MLAVWVFFGCALGGACRFVVMTVIARRFGEAFPWGTLTVNALGSLLLGFALGAGLGGGAAAFAGVGFCGGLTTFSTFSLQSLSLVSAQRWGRLAGNLLGSVAICLLCAIAGYALGEGGAG